MPPPSIEEIVRRIEKLHRRILAYTATLIYNTGNRQHTIAFSLHGTIMEAAVSGVTLMKAGLPHSVHYLLRGMVEALADLVNITADPGYAQVLHVIYLEQRGRMLRNIVAHSTSNGYLTPISEEIDAAALLAATEEELRSIREPKEGKTATSMTVRQKFERAGMLDEYEAVYALLSQHTHNNLVALQDRHAIRYGESVSLAYFRPMEPEEILPFLDALNAYPATALQRIRMMLAAPNDDGAEEIMREAEQIKQMIAA